MDEERDMSETNQEERLSTADLAHPRRDASREDHPVEEFPREDESGVRPGTKPVLAAWEDRTPSETQSVSGSVGTVRVSRAAPDLDRGVATQAVLNSKAGPTDASATRVAASRTTDATEGVATSRAVSDTGAAVATAREVETGPLFSPEETKNFRDRWDGIQVGFVDEPRRAVEQADGLVAAAMQRLAEQFSEERSRLEQQWIHGGDVSTEDLRLALRRYRSFFGRLLSV
ncbi:MAG: hypothetical protein WA715_10630 [Candidatus Acidiferrum sp.]